MAKPVQVFVKVFGERNTGTRAFLRMLDLQDHVITQQNFARHSLRREQNAALREQISVHLNGRWARLYSSAVLDMEHVDVCPTQAWKHAAIRCDPAFKREKVRVVFCVRNPYSWIISFAQRPYHIIGPRSKSLEEFIERPWMTQRRDNVEAILASPMQLWNSKLASYRSFEQQEGSPASQTVLFEDFVTSPVDVVRQVLDGFEIPASSIEAIMTSTKNSTKSLAEISAYYAQEGWREKLTAGLVTALNEKIDWEIAESYGYTRLNPADFPDKAQVNVATSKNWFHIRNLTSRWGFR